MNIEILKTDTFIKSYQNFTNDQHYEHVTKYFYEKSQDFKIKFFPFPYPEYQNLKFSFDTKEDCIRLENFFSKLNKPQYKYTLYEKCRLMETVYNEK
jgi:spore coat polysaccharide biosynthesis protein SpsF (cytidylyltransferase family)